MEGRLLIIIISYQFCNDNIMHWNSCKLHGMCGFAKSKLFGRKHSRVQYCSLNSYCTLSFSGPPTEVLCLHFFKMFCGITIYGRISLQEEFYETYLWGFQVNEQKHWTDNMAVSTVVNDNLGAEWFSMQNVIVINETFIGLKLAWIKHEVMRANCLYLNYLLSGTKKG